MSKSCFDRGKRKAKASFLSRAAGLALAVPGLMLAHANPIGLSEATLGKARVTVRYGRPKLGNRDPMRMIQPGQVWRMGADIPTTIESNVPLAFGHAAVPPGKHFLFVRWVEPGLWMLVVSRVPLPQYQPSATLAEVPLELERIPKPVEEVTIALLRRGSSERLAVSWGTYRLACSFTPAP